MIATPDMPTTLEWRTCPRCVVMTWQQRVVPRALPRWIASIPIVAGIVAKYQDRRYPHECMHCLEFDPPLVVRLRKRGFLSRHWRRFGLWLEHLERRGELERARRLEDLVD